MIIPHGTLIAIADGAGLALYRNAGTETALELQAVTAPKLDPHSKDAGKRHRSSTANPGKSVLAEDALAAAVVEWLNAEAIAGKFDHLIVAAPPKFLGEVRRGYHTTLRAKLLAELPKDIRELPAKEIAAELKAAKPA